LNSELRALYTAHQSTNYMSSHSLSLLARSLGKAKLSLGEEYATGPATSNQGEAERKIRAIWTDFQGMDAHLDAAAVLVNKGEDPGPEMLKAAAASLWMGLSQRVVSTAGNAYAELINGNPDHIMDVVRAELFEPAMAELKNLIKKHGSYGAWDAQSAAAQGDYERAIMLRENAHIARDLGLAFEIRKNLHPEALDDATAYFKDTASIDGMGWPAKPGDLNWWASALAHDWEAWFPTLAQWHELRNSAEHARARQGDTAPVFDLEAV
jgi:hypothetical protein